MTTGIRRPRTSALPPLVLLPFAVLVVLFGVAVLLAQVAPSRETGGVYQVTVGEGADPVEIPVESLTCQRNGATATCGTEVGGQRLEIDITYLGSEAADSSTCTARHGGRSVACQSRMGDYGHASHSVWISDGLGLTDSDLVGLRAAVPWWRTGDGLARASFALIGILGAVAGGAAFLLCRRAQPLPAGRRHSLVACAAVLAPALFVASGLVFAPSSADSWTTLAMSPLLALSPFSLVSAAVLALWQWQLSSADGRRRWTLTIGAFIATAGYTTMATFVLLLESGFID